MYFVANWKMYGNLSSLNTLDKVIKFSKSKEIKGGRLIYCPPNTLISSFSKKFINCQIGIGGQNCHESKDYGAHTGHVNSRMLKNIGAHFVIIGHSENRKQGESNKLINLKIKSALEAKLKVIFCIGETLQERESGKFFELLKNQLQKGIFHLSADAFSAVVLAYEPVWAIGTGLTASPAQAQEVHAFIRSLLVEQYGDAVAKSTSILYGGSCNPKNAAELFSQADIDGGLIGGASSKSRDFVDIVKAFNA